MQTILKIALCIALSTICITSIHGVYAASRYLHCMDKGESTYFNVAVKCKVNKQDAASVKSSKSK